MGSNASPQTIIQDLFFYMYVGYLFEGFDLFFLYTGRFLLQRAMGRSFI